MRFDERLDVHRALVFSAYPGAAEFSCAGTIAAWAREGVDVTYCCVTDGAAGTNDPTLARGETAQMRQDEQRSAGRALGVGEVVFLGFEDGTLYPDLALRHALARQIRLHRPDAVFAPDHHTRMFDVGGADFISHPDILAVGETVLRAINPDASTRGIFPELWTEEGLEPHKPAALFTPGGEFVVDITSTIDQKIAAFRCHPSQFHDGTGVASPVGDATAERLRMGSRNHGEGPEYVESFRIIRPF